MNFTEARSCIGHTVRGALIDDVEVRGGPTDKRIFLMSEGERIMNVSSLAPSEIPMGKIALNKGARHRVVNRRPEVKI